MTKQRTLEPNLRGHFNLAQKGTSVLWVDTHSLVQQQISAKPTIEKNSLNCMHN